MTLDEAILHAEEVASKCEFDTDWGMGNHFIDRSGVADVIECGKEHRQLAEWLKDYKRLLESVGKIKDLTKGTIDHFNLDDAMDMLYEIKKVVSRHDRENG